MLFSLCISLYCDMHTCSILHCYLLVLRFPTRSTWTWPNTIKAPFSKKCVINVVPFPKWPPSCARINLGGKRSLLFYTFWHKFVIVLIRAQAFNNWFLFILKSLQKFKNIYSPQSSQVGGWWPQNMNFKLELQARFDHQSRQSKQQGENGLFA